MAKTIYRGVEELNADEFAELKGALFCAMKDNQGEDCKYATADEIPDDEVKKNYEGVSFVEEDFWCNIK